MLANSFRSWNERPMPRRAIFQCGRPRMDLPSHEHLAAVRHQMPGHQVEQRGLAGAVRPDQRGDDAGAQRERHVVDGLQAAEGLGDAGRLQQDLAVRSLMAWPLSRAFGFSWKPHRPPGRIDHQQHHRETVDDLLDRADLGRRQIGHVAQARRQQQDQDGADDGAEQRRRAADDHHRHQLDRGLEHEALDIDEAQIERVERAARPRPAPRTARPPWS